MQTGSPALTRWPISTNGLEPGAAERPGQGGIGGHGVGEAVVHGGHAEQDRGAALELGDGGRGIEAAEVAHRGPQTQGPEQAQHQAVHVEER